MAVAGQKQIFIYLQVNMHYPACFLTMDMFTVLGSSNSCKSSAGIILTASGENADGCAPPQASKLLLGSVCISAKANSKASFSVGVFLSSGMSKLYLPKSTNYLEKYKIK